MHETDAGPQDAQTRAPVKFDDATERRIAERKLQAQITQAVRGTVWGKDASDAIVRGVAMYAAQNGLDAVRHIEVLGGKIYLTSEFYEERGAPLLLAGLVVKDEPDLIQADERLELLAQAGDEWAQGERVRRMRLRITHGVPEEAEGACIQTLRVGQTVILGVNWAGKGLKMVRKEKWAGPRTDRKPTGEFEEKDNDPVGGAEPVKTAITRAARRAWKQVATVIPAYGQQIATLEQRADLASVAMHDEAEQSRAFNRSAQIVPKALRPATLSDASYLGMRASDLTPTAVPVTEVSDADERAGVAAARARVARDAREPDPYGLGPIDAATAAIIASTGLRERLDEEA